MTRDVIGHVILPCFLTSRTFRVILLFHGSGFLKHFRLVSIFLDQLGAEERQLRDFFAAFYHCRLVVRRKGDIEDRDEC